MILLEFAAKRNSANKNLSIWFPLYWRSEVIIVRIFARNRVLRIWRSCQLRGIERTEEAEDFTVGTVLRFWPIFTYGTVGIHIHIRIHTRRGWILPAITSETRVFCEKKRLLEISKPSLPTDRQMCRLCCGDANTRVENVLEKLKLTKWQNDVGNKWQRTIAVNCKDWEPTTCYL